MGFARKSRRREMPFFICSLMSVFFDFKSLNLNTFHLDRRQIFNVSPARVEILDRDRQNPLGTFAQAFAVCFGHDVQGLTDFGIEDFVPRKDCRIPVGCPENQVMFVQFPWLFRLGFYFFQDWQHLHTLEASVFFFEFSPMIGYL